MGKRLVIGLLAAGGVSALCCVGSLAVVALSDDEGPGSRATQAGQGFSVTVPDGFSAVGPGHWTAERREGPNRLWLDVQQLAPLTVNGAIDEPLRALWARSLQGYEGPADPLIQRRFVSNGARAHFARATVKRVGNPDPVMVSLYLVEADDALVPLFLVQGCDTNEPGALMIIQYSFPTTHALVEAFLGGVAGSPVAAPLADEAELTGTWTFADTGTLQWAHQATGATAVTAVMRSSEVTLNADHSFRLAVTGGAGRAGEMKFASGRDEGRWDVEHDVLVLQGETSRKRYLVAGATRGPGGRRLLVLQPEPFSMGPNAEFELYLAGE